MGLLNRFREAVMSKNNKHIKVKDFVDPATRKSIVKMVDGTAPIKNDSRPYVRKEDVLAYLSESRTLQEIVSRFGYNSLASAYSVVTRLMKEGLATNLGHGIYVGTASNVKTFNAGQLSEKELQEKGLEAFKRNSVEQPQEEMKPEEKKPEKYSIRMRGIKIKGHKARFKAIIEFCSVPRSAAEVGAEFGYATSGVSTSLARMAKKGLLVSLPSPNSPSGRYRRYVSPQAFPQALEQEKTAPKEEVLTDFDATAYEDGFDALNYQAPPLDAVMAEGLALGHEEYQPFTSLPLLDEDPPSRPLKSQIVEKPDKDIEGLAKTYAWEFNINAKDLLALKRFVEWEKLQ